MATNGLGVGLNISPEVAAIVAAGQENQRRQRMEQEAEALARLEVLRREREKTRDRSMGEIVGDTGLGLASGGMGLVQSVYGLGNIATGGFLDEATGLGPRFDDAQGAIQGAQSQPLQLRREDANAAFDDGLWSGAKAYLTDPSLIADVAAQAVPSLIPTVAAGGIAARTVGAVGSQALAQQAARRAAIGTAGAQVAGSTNVEAVNTLREQGVDGLERQALGIGAGLGAGALGAGLTAFTGAGALEAAVGSRLAGMGGTGGGIVRGALSGAGRESVEEAAQSATETASVNAVAPDNTLLQGTGRAAVMGGIGGLAVGGPIGAFAGTGTTPEQRTQGQTQLEQDQAADALRAEQLASEGAIQRAVRTGNMPKGGVRALIEQQIKGQSGFTENDFASAVDMALLRGGATQVMGDDGVARIMRTNPDTQVLEEVPAGERQAVEQQLEAYLAGTTENLDLFGEPTDPAEAEPTGPALELTPADAESLAAIQARVLELEEAGLNRDEAAVQAVQELDPQGSLDLFGQREREGDFALGERFQQGGLDLEAATVEDDFTLGEQVTQGRLDLTPEEEEAFQFGQALEQQQIIFEEEDGSISVNEEQQELFDMTTQGMTSEQVDEVIQNIADARRKVREEGAKVRERVERLTGVSGEGANVGRSDLLSRQAAQKQEQERRQEEIIADRFRVEEDDNGDPVYLRYNQDIQALEQVPRSVAVKEANQVIAEQDAAAAEAARDPADRWKDALSERFGIKKQTMQPRNKEWQAFAEAANERRIQPDGPEAEAFLAEQAAALGADTAGAKVLGSTLGQWLADQQGEQAPPTAPPGSTQETEELVAGLEEQAAAPTPTEVKVDPEVQQVVDTEQQVNSTRTPGARQEIARLAGLMDRRVQEDIDQNAPRGQALDPKKAANLARKSLETEITASSSLQDLDETFSTILETNAWKVLDQQTRRKLTEKYNNLYSKLEPKFFRVNAEDNSVVDTRTAAQAEAGDPGAPTRAPSRRERRAERKRQKEQTTTPLTTERSIEMLRNAQVKTHATVADYRTSTGNPAPTDAAGVFDPDGVHVIMENIKTEEHLAEVLVHEKAHKGLSELLGDRLPAVTNRLWANAALRERIRAKMQSHSLDRSVAAEEVLVDMLAVNERLTGDVWSKIRSAVQSLFESILGVGSYRVTDRQVDRLLDDVSRQMRNPGAATLQRTSLTEGVIPLDALLGDPTPVTSTQRFSRAMDMLNGTVPQVNPQPGNYNRMDAAVKEATEASVTRFRGTWDMVKNGNYGRAMGGFTMPLNQMVNMWGRNFDRVVRSEDGTVQTQENPLRKVYRLKNEQEARLNQRVVRKREIKAEGRTFNDSAHEISDQATQYQRRHPDGAQALNVTLQESTRFQVWPNRTWEDQPAIDLKRHNLTEDERRTAYKELRKQWSKMGQEGQDLYLKIQASYGDIWRSRIQALEAELRRVHGLGPKDKLPANRLLELARRGLNEGPYSPLSRMGEHVIVVKSADGETKHFSAWETLTEAKYQEQGLRKEYPAQDGFAVSRSVEASRDNLRAGLNQEQLDILENALKDATPPGAEPAVVNSIHDALIETYLKMIPAGSFGQFSNRRNNVDGYSMDGMRAFSSYTVKAARQIASIEYDGVISQGFLEMRQHIKDKQNVGENTDIEQDVYNKVAEHHKASKESNFNKALAKLSGAGFLYYMTSPSQLFVNATQTFIVAMPRLAGRYGAARTLRLGMEALRNYFSSGMDFLGERAASEGAIDPAVQQVMQRLYEDGTLDFTLTGDLLEVAEAESGQLSSTWRNVMRVLASPIHKSEVFNRQVTAYMAAKMHAEENGISLTKATDEQVQSLYDVAKDAVDSTQFNYSQSNKSVIMQGPVKRLVMQFQQYRLNMLAMMAKDVRDSLGGNNASPEEKALARRSLAYMVGAQLAFTGAVGTAMSPIVFAIMDAFADDGEDFVDSRTAFIEAVPQWMAHGLLGGALNLDPGRVEVGSVLPILGERTYAPNTEDFTETATYYLERNIGPWFGLTTGAVQGVKDAMKGDFYKGGQGLLPKPMADVFRAIHERDGVRNKNGVITYDTGAWDTLTRAVGLRSAGIMEASVRQGAGYQAAKNIQRQRQNRLVKLAVAHATNDREAYREAMAEITAWNDSQPEFAVTGQDIGRILVNQAKAQSNVEQFGLPLSRTITPGFREATGISGI